MFVCAQRKVVLYQGGPASARRPVAIAPAAVSSKNDRLVRFIRVDCSFRKQPRSQIITPLGTRPSGDGVNGGKTLKKQLETEHEASRLRSASKVAVVRVCLSSA